MFYRFEQAQTRVPVENEARGIATCVIIEAENAEIANTRARGIGIYFDGVRRGRDCDCCGGDRWHRTRDELAMYAPELPAWAVTDVGDTKNKIAIHFVDGKVEWLDFSHATKEFAEIKTQHFASLQIG